MTERYAYYYQGGGADDGYIFVSFLGMGAQGAACLVRSIKTGKLCVRKAAYLYPTDSPAAEWMNATYEHPNIPHVLDAVMYGPPPPEAFLRPTNIQPLPMLATYWDYKNGGDLAAAYDKYSSIGEIFPEILLLKLVHEMLQVTSHLRSNRVVQADLLPCNIFLDWPEGAQLPDFSLGDYGRSRSHQLGSLGPSDELCQKTDPHSTYLAEKLQFEELRLYSSEVRSIADLIYDFVFDPSTNRPRPGYSPQIVDLFTKLMNCPHFTSINQNTPGSLDRLNAYVEQLSIYTGAALNLALAIADPAKLQYSLDLIRPLMSAEDLTPITYPDPMTLQTYPYQPPGPWNVVMLNEQGALVNWLAEAGVSYPNSPFLTGPTGLMLLREDATEVYCASGLAQL